MKQDDAGLDGMEQAPSTTACTHPSEPGCCGGMPRRSFLKLGGMGLVTLSLLDGCTVLRGEGSPVLQKDVDFRQLLAAGGRRPYEGEALRTIGMPCGGIGAGQLYVRGDGTLAHWWIANDIYNTGYGVYKQLTTPVGTYDQAYTTYHPYSPVEQGFALRVETGGGPVLVRELSRKDFDGIRFFGEYPVATIEYGTTEATSLPVSVRAEVFSPFIPLNARDSALPATVVRQRRSPGSVLQQPRRCEVLRIRTR